MRSFQKVAEQLVESHGDLTSEAVPKIACAADETKFWLTPSAQLRNPCFGPPTVYQDLSTRHDNCLFRKYRCRFANQDERKFEKLF